MPSCKAQSPYQPPFTVTSTVLDLVARISEEIGRQGLLRETAQTPALRRGNRLRSIQASLAIENNTLTLEQVTAVIAGKRVLGPPQEIQEVRNAFAAYEAMETFSKRSVKPPRPTKSAIKSPTKSKHSSSARGRIV